MMSFEESYGIEYKAEIQIIGKMFTDTQWYCRCHWGKSRLGEQSDTKVDVKPMSGNKVWRRILRKDTWISLNAEIMWNTAI